MKFSQAIDLYIADMRGEGRINSPNTERGYRDALTVHTVDVGDRDPRSTFREDVKRTLERWPNPEHAPQEPLDPRVLLRLGDAGAGAAARQQPGAADAAAEGA
jgi:hypothetical protein